MSSILLQQDQQKPYLTPFEAAELLGISERTLRDFRRRGVGPRYAAIGGQYRYRRADIDRYVRERLMKNK